MTNPNRIDERVTLLLQDDEGQDWPLYLDAACIRFVGHYPRVENFGRLGTLLRYVPGKIA